MTPATLYRLMRVVPWATPRRVRRLTDRQILRLCQVQGGGEPEEAEEAPQSPPRGSADEYANWRAGAMMFGLTQEQVDAEWGAKRGPVPGQQAGGGAAG